MTEKFFNENSYYNNTIINKYKSFSMHGGNGSHFRNRFEISGKFFQRFSKISKSEINLIVKHITPPLPILFYFYY